MGQHWHDGFQFIMCCLCYNISPSKLVYVPQLVFEYGGVNFFLVYAVVCVMMTIPMMHLQVSLAQFASSGNRGVLESVPLLRGFAYAKIVLVWWGYLPLGERLAFSLIYFVYAFQTVPPWMSCSAAAEITKDCFVRSTDKVACHDAWLNLAHRYRTSNLSEGIAINLDENTVVVPRLLFDVAAESCVRGRHTAAELFFRSRSQSSEEITLWAAVTWILVYMFSRPGIVNCAEILRAFTTLSMTVTSIIAVRIAFLPGAFSNFLSVLVKWKEFYNIKLWSDVIEVHLHDVGITSMVLYRIASYNKFSNDFRWQIHTIVAVDLIACLIAAWFCSGFVGHLGEAFAVLPTSIFRSSTDLLYVVVPEVMSMWSLPRIWCTFYFLSLLLPYLIVPVIFTESAIEVFLYEWPKLEKYKPILCGGIYTVFFAAQSGFAVKGGWRLLDFLSFFGSGAAITEITLLEMVLIVRLHGIKRIDIYFKAMVGSPPNAFIRICWTSLFPAVPMVLILVRHAFFSDADHTKPYSTAIGSVGLVVSFSVIIVYSIVLSKENKFDWTVLTSPTIRWHPKQRQDRFTYKELIGEDI
ncbi:sodium- and chloride-dependent glycine transporter 2-like [Ornithodoros turicata]|uniref:sodium- and chloride-dependent glycine transporter 2-like n=1 Tax=Ornithodoros turicata TaxID=34597 RepID=UPI00313A4880